MDKRPGESIWFKGKENYHFNSVLFCLGYREYLYFCTGLKLVCLGLSSCKNEGSNGQVGTSRMYLFPCV